MNRILYTLILSFFAFTTFAQFPVTSVPQLVSPHSIYLSDYVVPGSDKFTLNIWLNDNNEVDYDVRLTLQIEGEGISLTTAPEFMPTPLTLSAGGNILYGGDIQEYFNLNNMVVSGIDEQTLKQTGALPPGMYSFCIQAFDYRRQDVVLSQRGCTTVALSKNNPPIPTFPECGSVIAANPQSNLMFQWQSMADNTIQSEYTFTLVEVPNGISPDDALNGSGRTLIAPGDAITTTGRFIYDINQLALEPGRTYAYRIQVIDTEGFTTFENDGLSQSCYFFYGMPENGEIVLKRPSDGKKLKTKDEISTIRFVWDKPTNAYPNQTFNYVVKVVSLDLNQTPEEAIQYNPVLWDTIMDPAIYLSGGEIRKKIELPRSNVFAWQVYAYIDAHEFAKSPVWTFNKGALLEEFYAGKHTIIVDETESFDLNHFTGKGRVKLDTGDEYTKVYFNDITVRPGAENVMTRGEVTARLRDYEYPLEFGENGDATLRGDSLILTTEDVWLRGQVVWDYPFPTTQTSSIATITSKSKRIMFNDMSPLENVLFEEATFELLEPFGYTAKYYDDSYFTMKGKELTTSMHVDITISDKVTTLDDKKITIPFFEQTDVNTYINENTSSVSPIHLLDGTTLTLNPKTAICDFSDSNSPGNQSGAPDWKGMYFGKFDIHFDKKFDKSNQVILDESKKIAFDLSENTNFKAWTDAQGLQFFATRDFEENKMAATFNTFHDELKSLRFNIVNNSVEDGQFTGTVQIPVLNPTSPFAYTVPIDNESLKTGFLDEDLSSREVIFNDDRPEFRLEMKLQQAVFQDNNRLNLVVDVAWKSIDVYLPGVTDLNIWGNGNFGFNTPNGSKGVNNVEGRYVNTYKVTIDSLSAGMTDGMYGFGFIGGIILGDAESGISGTSPSNPPKFNMVSAEQKGQKENNVATAASNWLKQYVDTDLVDMEKEKTIPLFIPIKIKTPVADVTGRIVSVHDDPDWGNAFYGKVTAKIKKPKTFTLSAKVLVGKKEETSYWFVEVGAKAGADKKDPNASQSSKEASRIQKFGAKVRGKKLASSKKIPGQRVGIKLGKIEIVELKGRVYHHMNHDMSVAMNSSCSLKPKTTTVDPLMKFQSVTDINLNTIFDNMEWPDFKALFCKLDDDGFTAVLSALPAPDYDHLEKNIPDVDWPMIKTKYPQLSYSRLKLMFPQGDWCHIVATLPDVNIDWGYLLMNLPTVPDFPNLCELNSYAWNKIVAAFDEQSQPDSAWLVENQQLSSKQWMDLKIKSPSISWRNLTTEYKGRNWCGTFMLHPDFDLGSLSIDIDFPTLTLPDWRFWLPKLNLNWPDFGVDLPGIDIPDLPVSKAIDIKYDVNASTSYGGMLMVGIQDAMTSGRLAQAKGTLEVSFDDTYNLKQIGLQLEGGFGNKPGETDFKKSMVQTVGCLTYTASTETFIADLEAIARKGVCVNANMHLQISPGQFDLEIGSEQDKVTVVPGCVGSGAFGWLYINRKNDVTKVGAGLGLGMYANLQTPEIGIDGVCSGYGFFRAKAELGIKAEAQVEPEFKFIKAGVFFDSSVDIGVSISGVLCPFGDINALHLGLRGNLTYYFEDSLLKGEVSGEAEIFGFIEAEFEFGVNLNL